MVIMQPNVLCCAFNALAAWAYITCIIICLGWCILKCFNLLCMILSFFGLGVFVRETGSVATPLIPQIRDRSHVTILRQESMLVVLVILGVTVISPC